MIVLGVNSVFHESSACLIENGTVVAAAEEERFNRRKHGKPFRIDNPHHVPSNAVDYCLTEADVPPSAVDHVAYSFDPERRLEGIEFNDDWDHDGWGTESGEETFYENLQSIPTVFERTLCDDFDFHWVDHHRSHAASAFYPAQFDESAVLVVDGTAETDSTSLFTGTERELRRIDDYPITDSVGFLWEIICVMLGFSSYDAGKVMALASYGDPTEYIETFREFVTVEETDYRMNTEVLEPGNSNSVEWFTEQFGYEGTEEDQVSQDDMDIAAALQQITEEILLALTRRLDEWTTTPNLCLAGGVALNCVANTRVKTDAPFENVYVQPAAHDAGTALGAALEVSTTRQAGTVPETMTHPFLGPSYSNDTVQRRLDEAGLSWDTPEDLVGTVADYIADGDIVAWFQGRLEFGPRALGNRSILADPRREDVRDVINEKVKHREWFRPFAPSVLRERVEDFFDVPMYSRSTEFMLFAYDVPSERRDEIPGVVHTDGTSRIQAVDGETNPRYHDLISAFESRTGVPILLNTSFNDREPIVCSPEDAISTFERTNIDHLVLEDCLVSADRTEV